jgi:hypothetical protein
VSQQPRAVHWQRSAGIINPVRRAQQVTGVQRVYAYVDRRYAEELVRSPTETLKVELKRWLDLATDEHRAKIVRATGSSLRTSPTRRRWASGRSPQ